MEKKIGKTEKIVINALPYKKNSSGIGILIKELFGTFSRITERKCQIILSNDSPYISKGENTELIFCSWKNKQGIRRILFQSFLMGRKYCKNAILLTTDSKLPFFLPKTCVVVSIITDMAVFRMPEVFQKSRVILWRLQYFYLRHRVNKIIAISDFTKQEIVTLLKVPEKKIDVVPCAADDGFKRITDENKLKVIQKKYKLPESYILYVGNLNPRKNLIRIMKAFDLLKNNENIPHHLVIVGGNVWKFNKISAISENSSRDYIHFLDYVPKSDMAAIYSMADLFVFPTLYEGFGIPIVEAQLCGVPVLTSNVSSMPEVGGEGAVYVGPYNIEDISKKMLEVISDKAYRQSLIKKGYENAKRFSWINSAKKLKNVLEGSCI